MTNNVALISGVSGQDGILLSSFLLDKGYKVFGFSRSEASQILNVLKHVKRHDAESLSRFQYCQVDICDRSAVIELIKEIQPDELYHYASQSNVKLSENLSTNTIHSNVIGSINMLDAISLYSKDAKCLFANSSEIFDGFSDVPQDESSAIKPRNPYGISKAMSLMAAQSYRDVFHLHLSNSISFNHESSIRGEQYVSRKVSVGLCRIKLGLQECIELGNLHAMRDWGYAGDFVYAHWLMTQQKTPSDYVLGTGISHSVAQLVETAAACLNMKILWIGEGPDTIGVWENGNKAPIIRVSENFYRHESGLQLLANASKAHNDLGWKPTMSFKQLVEKMVAFDLMKIQRLEQ